MTLNLDFLFSLFNTVNHATLIHDNFILGLPEINWLEATLIFCDQDVHYLGNNIYSKHLRTSLLREKFLPSK